MWARSVDRGWITLWTGQYDEIGDSSGLGAARRGVLVSASLCSLSAFAEKRDFQITASSDDAEEDSSGGMDLTSSDLELVTESTVQTVGMRFTNITIPQGATILSAVLEFETDETDTGVTSLTIQGQDIDDAPTFTNGNSNISNRTLTTASTSWSPPAWSTVSERHLSPDLTSIVQEIVDRTGWSSGNDMVFVVTGSGERTAESFNGESANAPILRIEFSGLQSTPGGALCYGAGDGSNLFVIIDTTDGTVDTNLGDMGVPDVESIAIDPNGSTSTPRMPISWGASTPRPGVSFGSRFPSAPAVARQGVSPSMT